MFLHHMGRMLQVAALAVAGGSPPPSTDGILLSGDEQTGADRLSLSGDEGPGDELTSGS